MQYECRMCGTTFLYNDGRWKDGYLICPSCGSEDLYHIEPFLKVNAFPIDLETLSDAEWNKDNWIMEQARIDLVELVKKSLDKEDRNRLQLYQERTYKEGE